ncbi:MAG TPA: hypothetical protein VGD67_12310 [Pseudonocardiaceae bacterium]
MSLSPSVAACLPPAELDRCLAVRDLTDPAAGPHALQLLVAAVVAALPGEHRVGRAPAVVSVLDNYENLGYPADAVTRDVRYTRYVSPTQVLRSHTSAMVPAALRALAAEGPAAPPDVLLAHPGMCYRRDSVDRLHTGTPHQLDLWRLRRAGPPGGSEPLGEDDLEAMIAAMVGAALPGARWRAVPAEHPYTTHGRQLDVLAGPGGLVSGGSGSGSGEWVEIGECGLAAPGVLRGAGLPAGWTGLAMGLGLDRLLMLRKGIPDIRLLRATDPRVAGQLLDLAPYRPVSRRPPVRRDLSLVVGPDTDATVEALGDRVRAALGAAADTAEDVSVLADTPYAGLPPAARERLRLRPGQRNVLVRLTLRPLDGPLTDAGANALRDTVYLALHEGEAVELASPDPHAPP